MKWDKWIGSADGRPVMWTRKLIDRPWIRVDLHKFVDVDSRKSYHTHPAYAIRAILWNGYVEELEDGTLVAWRAGDIGLVKPRTSHRVDGVLRGRPAYSLWIRIGPEIAEVELRGDGWPKGTTPWRCSRCGAYGVALELLPGPACPDCELALR